MRREAETAVAAERLRIMNQLGVLYKFTKFTSADAGPLATLLDAVADAVDPDKAISRPWGRDVTPPCSPHGS